MKKNELINNFILFKLRNENKEEEEEEIKIEKEKKNKVLFQNNELIGHLILSFLDIDKEYKYVCKNWNKICKIFNFNYI
jgi:hypothetical protein